MKSPTRIEERHVEQGAIVGALTDSFRSEFATQAADGLYRLDPVLSARYVLSTSQKVIGIVLLLIVIACAVVWPLTTLMVDSRNTDACRLYDRLGFERRARLICGQRAAPTRSSARCA